MHAAGAPLLWRLLQAIDHKAAGLAAHLHPAWVAEVCRRAGLAPPSADGGDAERWARLLTQAYDLRWPPLTALRAPVHRLALLGRQDTLRVLAVRALQAQADRVRCSIGREAREWLAACLGPQVQALLSEGATQRMAEVRPLAAHELDLEALATAGYRLLCRDGAWQSREALALTRMCLPPQLPAAPAAATNESSPPGTLPAAMDAYFPELTWLFGCDMSQALSV